MAALPLPSPQSSLLLHSAKPMTVIMFIILSLQQNFKTTQGAEAATLAKLTTKTVIPSLFISPFPPSSLSPSSSSPAPTSWNDCSFTVQNTLFPKLSLHASCSSSSLTSPSSSFPKKYPSNINLLKSPIDNNSNIRNDEGENMQGWSHSRLQQQEQIKQQQQQQQKCFGRETFLRSSIASSILCFSSTFSPSLQPSLANAMTTNNKKPLSSSSSSFTLEDALDQIDLAVRASSVQAWEDASNLIFDEILDASNLSRALTAVSSSTNSDQEEVQKRISEYIQNMRNILSSSSVDAPQSKRMLRTEDAMSVMKYGTNARTLLKECIH